MTSFRERWRRPKESPAVNIPGASPGAGRPPHRWKKQVQVPQRFSPMASATFAARAGPFHVSRDGDPPAVGLLVEAHHANTMGSAHGGVLATLADVALGQAVKAEVRPGSRVMTASMHLAFLGPGAVGDWIEAHATIDRRGSSLVFASCEIRSGERPIAKVSAVFAVRDAVGQSPLGGRPTEVGEEPLGA